VQKEEAKSKKSSSELPGTSKGDRNYNTYKNTKISQSLLLEEESKNSSTISDVEDDDDFKPNTYALKNFQEENSCCNHSSDQKGPHQA
jgi:hypothetical protein